MTMDPIQDPDAVSNTAASELAITRALLAELSNKVNEFLSAERDVDQSIREHYKVLSQLEAKKRDIKDSAFDVRRKMRELEQKVRSQEQLASQEAENARVKAEYKRLTEEFDEIIKKFEWSTNALPHQIEGAKKLAIAKRGILGDKRGLGKTLTSIAWADLIEAKKVLAIVPNDIMRQFQREVHQWAPHKVGVQVIGGKTKAERAFILEFLKDEPEVFAIINYEAWRKDFNLLEQLKAVQFDTVICDEAHTLKEVTTNAFRGVDEIVYAKNQCNQCSGSNISPNPEWPYGLHCLDCKATAGKDKDFCSVKHILPMTGTPILNKPQDFFPLLYLVDRVQFNDRNVFLRTYCQRNWKGKWEFREGGVEELTTHLSGLYVARNRDQAGVVLPKQEIQYYDLTLDPTEHPEQFKAYQTLRERSTLVINDLLSEAEETHRPMLVMHAIALITRERQMMTWPSGIRFTHPTTKQMLFQCDVEESVKVDKVIDRNNEGLIPQFVDEGERTVLFSQFKQPLIEIEKRLNKAGISCVRYDGDTSKDLAQEVQMDFDRKYQSLDKPYRWDVVLAHYKKGGVGLNLNAATQTIILDEEWNPGKEDQAYGRTDRMGQTEETTVHVLRVQNSIDVWMANIKNEKAKMIEGFETHADLQQELWDILRGFK